MSAGSLALATPRLSRMLAWRPEAAYWLVVGGAWLVIASGVGSGHGMDSAAMHQQPQAAFVAWMLMVVAMMLPLAMSGARHVGRNSLRCRRQRAMATYLFVFVASWAPAGVLVAMSEASARTLLGGWWVPVALAVAASWQLTRPKRRALLACHRTLPLPPLGRAADLAVARFATFQAMRCARSCWALMLAALAVGHSVLAMAGLAALVLAEEMRLPRRELQRWFALPLTAATVVSLALMLAWTSARPSIAAASQRRARSPDTQVSATLGPPFAGFYAPGMRLACLAPRDRGNNSSAKDPP